MNGITSALVRRVTRDMISFSLPCEDTASRLPSAAQEEGPCQTPNLSVS